MNKALPMRGLAGRRGSRVGGQRGMALMIALIVLVVVSILGVTAMRAAMFQNRVSINNQLDTLSFQASESGIDTALALARAQSLGPDGAVGGGDDMDASNPAHIFNIAISDPTHPRRLCSTAGATQVYADGVRNADESIGYTTPCPALPNSTVQVTTVISRSPDPTGLIEGFDAESGTVLAIQIRATGTVVNTSANSTHAEDWLRIGPY